MDCGFRDQYRIHFGMRRFAKKLKAAKIPFTYEEFDDDHSDVDYRMDVFLPFLANALYADAPKPAAGNRSGSSPKK
jgi:hypothetical protein